MDDPREPGRTTLTLRLEQETYERLMLHAIENRTTVSDLIQVLVHNHLAPMWDSPIPIPHPQPHGHGSNVGHQSHEDAPHAMTFQEPPQIRIA